MRKPAKEKTTPITFRLPKRQVELIDAAAAAAGLDRSHYLRLRFKNIEPPAYPALAALGRIIAIHEIVAADPPRATQLLAELKLLVFDLSMIARHEASR